MAPQMRFRLDELWMDGPYNLNIAIENIYWKSVLGIDEKFLGIEILPSPDQHRHK